MAKFVSFSKAAEMLGISEDELTQMRERHDIHGYRDGSTWKFKEEEIERVKQQLAEAQTPQQQTKSQAEPDSGELLDLPIDLDEDSADVVLLSEHELGESDPGTSSTIIGRSGEPSPDESDVRIITDEDRQGSDVLGGSDVQLVPASGSGKGSDVELVVSDSGVVDQGETGEVEPDAPTEIRSDLDLELPGDLEGAGSDIGLGTEPTQSPSDAGSELALGSDALGVSLDDELSLQDDDFDLADIVTDDDSVSALGGEEEEMVLDTGPQSSDITQRPADSGISLASVSDSGISLEEPLGIEDDEASLEITGTQEDEFELAGDELISLADDADSEELQEIRTDESSEDDFLLTPIDEAAELEESDDSGSQVIALDSESDFGQADLLEEDTHAGLLEEETAAPAAGLEDAAAQAEAMPVAVATGAARETQFTGLSVLSLGICWLLLSIAGMMTYDLMRNMWVWEGPLPMSSAVMDTILGLFGG
ncbi:MAG TPA: helix-turn-helix domain-containing protein [Planctomycetaceae bacterium]|nr:helix-turn-helix domain-containing protein [Planctomycetaceae bacterium]